MKIQLIAEENDPNRAAVKEVLSELVSVSIMEVVLPSLGSPAVQMPIIRVEGMSSPFFGMEQILDLVQWFKDNRIVITENAVILKGIPGAFPRHLSPGLKVLHDEFLAQVVTFVEKFCQAANLSERESVKLYGQLYLDIWFVLVKARIKVLSAA